MQLHAQDLLTCLTGVMPCFVMCLLWDFAYGFPTNTKSGSDSETGPFTYTETAHNDSIDMLQPQFGGLSFFHKTEMNANTMHMAAGCTGPAFLILALGQAPKLAW